MVPGPLTTGQFRVEVSTRYRVAIDFDQPASIPEERLDCLMGMGTPTENCAATPAVFDVRWALFRGDQFIGRGSSEGGFYYWSMGPTRSLLSFDGKEGQSYRVDLSILANGGELSPARPKLEVEPANFEFAEDFGIGRFFARLEWALLILVGGILIAISLAWKPRAGQGSTQGVKHSTKTDG
jgi:hypothetical protein